MGRCCRVRARPPRLPRIAIAGVERRMRCWRRARLATTLRRKSPRARKTLIQPLRNLPCSRCGRRSTARLTPPIPGRAGGSVPGMQSPSGRARNCGCELGGPPPAGCSRPPSGHDGLGEADQQQPLGPSARPRPPPAGCPVGRGQWTGSSLGSPCRALDGPSAVLLFDEGETVAGGAAPRAGRRRGVGGEGLGSEA